MIECKHLGILQDYLHFSTTFYVTRNASEPRLHILNQFILLVQQNKITYTANGH